jgi:hypothetical protein
VVAGFADADRGKLIMACGTDKTFTSLKIAETEAGSGADTGHLQAGVRGCGAAVFQLAQLPQQAGAAGPVGDSYQSPEEFKAWSQNLGHESMLTTYCSYGTVPQRRQGEIIKGLASLKSRVEGNDDELGRTVLRAIRDHG